MRQGRDDLLGDRKGYPVLGVRKLKLLKGDAIPSRATSSGSNALPPSRSVRAIASYIAYLNRSCGRPSHNAITCDAIQRG